MFKLKRHMIKESVFLGICLISFSMNCFNFQSKNTQINKFVAGSYKENSIKENIDIKNNSNLMQKYTELSSDIINETSMHPEKSKNISEEQNEKQDPIGKPIKAELTAYSDDPRSSGKWKSQTAMQTRTRLGVVAAPSNISLGSKIYIPELKNYKKDGMFDVEDRGGAIKIKRDGTYIIDVWVPTHEEALKFGRKSTTIYLIE